MVIQQTAQEEGIVCHIACPSSQLLHIFPPTRPAAARLTTTALLLRGCLLPSGQPPSTVPWQMPRPPAVTGHVVRQRHPHIRRQRRHRLHVLSGCDVG